VWLGTRIRGRPFHSALSFEIWSANAERPYPTRRVRHQEADSATNR
jgi:hypothetical protein